jgi:hypothetical protein
LYNPINTHIIFSFIFDTENNSLSSNCPNTNPNEIDITISEPDLSGFVIVKLNPNQVPSLEVEPIRPDVPIGRVSELEWRMRLDDIHLVSAQSGVSNKRAAIALISNSFDIVDAIMELTM